MLTLGWGGGTSSSANPARAAKGGGSTAADEFMASLEDFKVDLDVDFDDK